ncbi:hypothetical protein [Flavobacterium sp. AG291]|uniref:hypothetical protein n=1 Tax=Flavobacterium sp. AG291 TaxID=2184000 RepID=UPI000E0A3966|nr:hypothetical protein [Flavobacterium sp. AG291]RDI11125.1 hypothetical protein DEU42_10659 [Flavobacterium sp. AG291]
MKLRASFIVIVFAFLFSTEVSAQVDRRIAPNQYKRDSRKPEKVDFVEQSTEYLTKALTLDDFQKAAIKEIIEGERESIMNLNTNRDMSADERRDKASAISARIYKKVLPLLSKEQAEKYTKMEESKKF